MRLWPTLTSVVAIAIPSPGLAWICPRVPLSPFELADRAAEVAVVVGENGTVQVEQVLKGSGAVWQRLPAGDRPAPAVSTAPPTAAVPPAPPRRRGRRVRVIQLEGPRCRQDSIREDASGRALAFATAEGWSVHPAGGSVIALPPDARLTPVETEALLGALRQWLSTPAPEARRRLLLDLARRPDRLGFFAAMHFATAPDLLRSMPRAEAVELAIAIEAHLRLVREPLEGWPLMTALARLHLPEGIPVLIDLLTRPQWSSPEAREAVVDSLGLLVNRVINVDVDPLALWARVDRASRDQLVRDGFAERGVAQFDPASPTSLASIIRSGPTAEDRMRALDLCEQATGRAIALDPSVTWDWPGFGSAFLDGVAEPTPQVWEQLARRCAP